MTKKQAEINSQIENPESWVDQYGDFLYHFTLSRIKNPSIAEDLVQETFLAALKARKNFQGRSSTRTWLIAILKHKLVDHIRQGIRERTSDMGENMINAAANDPAETSFNDSVDGASSYVQILSSIQDTIADLKKCRRSRRYTRRGAWPFSFPFKRNPRTNETGTAGSLPRFV